MAMNLGLSSPEMLSRMRRNEEIDRQRNQARRAGISGPALGSMATLFGGGGSGPIRTPQVMPQRPGGAAMGGGRPVSSSMGGMDPRTMMGNGPIDVGGPAVPPDVQRAQMEQMLAMQAAQVRAQQQSGQMNGPSVMGSPDQQLRQQMAMQQAMQQYNQMQSSAPGGGMQASQIVPRTAPMAGPQGLQASQIVPRTAPQQQQPVPLLSRDQARQISPGSMMGGPVSSSMGGADPRAAMGGAPQRPGGAAMGGGRTYSQPAPAALDPRRPADPSTAMNRASPWQAMLDQQAQVWNALQQGGINAPWMAGAGMAGQYEPYRQQGLQQQASTQPQTNVPPRYQRPGYLPPSRLQQGPTRVSGGPMWGPDRNPRPAALRADARNAIQGMVADSMMTRPLSDYNTGQYRPPGGFNQTPDRDVNRQLRLLYNDMNKLPGFEGRTAVPDIPPANKPDEPDPPPTDPPPTDPETPVDPTGPGVAPIPDNWDSMNPRERNQWLLANTTGLQLPEDFSSLSRGDRIRWLRDNYPGLDWDNDGSSNPGSDPPPTDPPPTDPPPTDPPPTDPPPTDWSPIPQNWSSMDPRARNQWLLGNTAGLQLPSNFSSMSRGDRIRWLRDNYPGLDWNGDGISNPIPGRP